MLDCVGGGVGVVGERLDTRTFWNNGNVLYLKWNGVFAEIYICHIS
jgi:hypothetical protein